MWSAGVEAVDDRGCRLRLRCGQRHHDRQQRHHRKSTSPKRNGKLHLIEKDVRFGKKPDEGEMDEGKINGKHSRTPTAKV